MTYDIQDPDYRLDFGRLYGFVAGRDPTKIARAVLFGSRPPPNDSLWKMAKKCGFDVIVEDRNIRNREKKIDTGIVTAMMRDAYTRADKKADTFTLVAGDGDFVPTVRTLVVDGFRVDVAFWSHASKELREACSKFYTLNPYLDGLKYEA